MYVKSQSRWKKLLHFPAPALGLWKRFWNFNRLIVLG